MTLKTPTPRKYLPMQKIQKLETSLFRVAKCEDLKPFETVYRKISEPKKGKAQFREYQIETRIKEPENIKYYKEKLLSLIKNQLLFIKK